MCEHFKSASKKSSSSDKASYDGKLLLQKNSKIGYLQLNPVINPLISL